MRITDHYLRQDCHVVPFIRLKVNEDKIAVSSIAVIIAVSILHRESESPEERLIEIIDASGEAEVLDIADGLAQYETHWAPKSPPHKQTTTVL